MKAIYIKPEIETVSVEAEAFMDVSGNEKYNWSPDGGSTIFNVYSTDDDINDDDVIG